MNHNRKPRPKAPMSAAFLKEQTSKEQLLILNGLRTHAKLSVNPALRSMNMTPIFEDNKEATTAKRAQTTGGGRRTLNKTNYFTQKNDLSLVDGDDGSMLVSRGPLPSMIPARYDNFPTAVDWTLAESKCRDLERELSQVNKAISKKELEIKVGTLAVGGMSHLQKLGPKAGSEICGSAFQWSGTSATTSERVYQWPSKKQADDKKKDKKDSDDVRNKQYGDMTRICDLANGNVFVNKEATKKVRGTVTSSSARPGTLPLLPVFP